MLRIAEPAAADVWKRAVRVVLVVAIVAMVAVAVRERHVSTGGTDGPPPVTLYAFSSVRELIDDELIPAYRAVRRAEDRGSVEFVSTFAGSGRITRDVLRRFPADVAILSSEIDAWRLVEGGVLPGPTWRDEVAAGFALRSPIVFLVRDGVESPATAWSDLVRPDLEVIVPDPATSGCGELAIVAIFGAARLAGASESEAVESVQGVFDRVVAMPPTARDARIAFDRGRGDVALLYEAEARRSGAGRVVVPTPTLVAEAVACALPPYRGEAHETQVREWLEFLRSEHAREATVRAGFETGPWAGEVGSRFRLADVGDPKDLRRKVVETVLATADRSISP